LNQDKIERFRQFVEREPDNPLHNFALAQAYLGAGEWESGERSFARCLEIDPQWMVAAIKRGRCLVELERWAEAREALDRGAELARQQSHEEPFEEIRELMDQLPADA
jgi:tetratricopeptide (TPR) repeat protein